MAVWYPEGEESQILQDLARPFFFVVFFRISLDGLNKRGTTGSLITKQQMRYLEM